MLHIVHITNHTDVHAVTKSLVESLVTIFSVSRSTITTCQFRQYDSVYKHN